VDAADGVDLLIHETFPSAGIYAQKANVPLTFAEQIVNGVHTSPAAAGGVFKRAGARMSVMWHLAVDHETVGPVYAEVRTRYDGPVSADRDRPLRLARRRSHGHNRSPDEPAERAASVVGAGSHHRLSRAFTAARGCAC
jgi:cytochrome c551/c552